MTENLKLNPGNQGVIQAMQPVICPKGCGDDEAVTGGSVY